MTTSFRNSLAAVLLASTVVGGVAYAAEQTAPASAVETPAQKAVDRDVGKLSKDGAKALRDMNGARLAIFDAQPKQAKEMIDRAETALTKAKTDAAVFVKAESELKSPANKTAAKTSEKTDVNEKLAWLPVDGQLTLGEDFVATPEKAAAVADANKSLQKGDKQGALEKLKLAHIDVNLTLAVLPLEKTTADVKQAATLIDQGKYYEANAVLKTAEDRVRFDVVDTILLPQAAAKASATKADTTGSTQAAKPADAKPAAK